MARQAHIVHEPLFHIAKRDDCGLVRAWAVRLAAFALSLVVCGGVIVALTGLNPLEVYGGIIDGAVGTGKRLWNTLRDTLTLLLVAVAITPAFRMRFWNVGGEATLLICSFYSCNILFNTPLNHYTFATHKADRHNSIIHIYP